MQPINRTKTSPGTKGSDFSLKQRVPNLGEREVATLAEPEHDPMILVKVVISEDHATGECYTQRQTPNPRYRVYTYPPAAECYLGCNGLLDGSHLVSSPP